ncbi:A/G-specific adenine glycosylase [bacterium]|nr:A/G-specific adenine glycosylase [bacterium]
MKPKQFQQAVLNWFEHQGRTNLPWQNPTTPYRVWISEIMLQQTQVATVIPYFERFMQSFPCIESLANASVDDVLHHWTGLGYYARARNLHKTAQIVAFEHQQQFPDTVEALSALPGIGRSTAGAIRSIGFKKPAAILDGNVKRVLARFSATAGWPGKTAVHNQLWDIAEHYSPLERTEQYTQAMMDLGALVCTRSNPQCYQCPIESNCKASLKGEQSLFPGKKPKKAIPVRESIFLMLRSPEGDILLQQNPPAGLWGGLWVMPTIDQLSELDALAESLQLEIKTTNFLTEKRHSFSHFHLDYQVYELEVLALYNKVAENSSVVWYNRNNPLSLGMPAPIKALLN